MPDRAAVITAIRSSWCADTSAASDWSMDNPAEGQCESASFVAWRYLGGDLVHARVLIDGEQVEYHYWNRIDGEDLDLTLEQFRNGQEIVEINVLASTLLAERIGEIEPTIAGRIDRLTERVETALGAAPLHP